MNGQIDEHTSSGNVDVRAVTVDELAEEHGVPQLVMIDVEGYEGHVLDGAVRMLDGRATTFLVEIHEELADYGGSATEIVDRFADFERFVAVEDDDPLLALEGPPPDGRFFLIAIPPGSPA